MQGQMVRHWRAPLEKPLFCVQAVVGGRGALFQEEPPSLFLLTCFPPDVALGQQREVCSACLADLCSPLKQ